MVAEGVRFFMDRPIAVALGGAHFLIYALPAWAVLLVRLAMGRMGRRELGLFAIFTGALLLEGLQLAVDGFSFFDGEAWGFPRYFGVFAPLLWLWAAWSLAALWNVSSGWRRGLVRSAVVVALGWVFISQGVMSLEAFYRKGARHDALVAAERIAPTIRDDYRGPKRQAESKRILAEYFTTRRPVVFGDFAAAAWMVRGQSEGAIQGRGLCPYPDDYLFIRVGSGYGGMNTVDSRLYDYVRSVRGGLGAEWRLFRRKTTPHKDMTDARRLNQRHRMP